MTAPACGTCGAAVSDAFLCDKCTQELAATLTLAASIAPDLQDAAARQLARGNAIRAAGGEPPLPFDPYAARARDGLQAVLEYWAREVTGRVTATISGAAISLSRHLGGLRQHPQAQDAHAAITAAVHRAATVIDRPPERFGAGNCDGCGAPLFTELDADSAPCQCGTVTLRLIARRAERAAAADLLGTATEISGQLAMIGVRVSAGTIRMWASRGRLAQRPGSAALPFYAMSDVLVLVAERDSRKAS